MGGPAERLTRKGLAIGNRSAAEFNYYVQALQANPRYAPARLHLAEWYRAHKQDNEALAQYLSALAADPNFAIAHFSLAEFLWHGKPDPTPAEGSEPRYEMMPGIRRLELARYHLQIYLDMVANQQSHAFHTEARIMLAAIEGDLAKLKNAKPLTRISWNDAARRLARPADPSKSPYLGPRLPLAIEFARGSSTISHASTYLLDAVARALGTEELASSHILIEGNADSEGDSSANLALSKKRAQSVRDYFVSRGLSADRFLLAAYGEHRPLVPNDTPELRKMNRRIEVVNWDAVLRARESPGSAMAAEATAETAAPTPTIASTPAPIPAATPSMDVPTPMQTEAATPDAAVAPQPSTAVQTPAAMEPTATPDAAPSSGWEMYQNKTE